MTNERAPQYDAGPYEGLSNDITIHGYPSAEGASRAKDALGGEQEGVVTDCPVVKDEARPDFDPTRRMWFHLHYTDREEQRAQVESLTKENERLRESALDDIERSRERTVLLEASRELAAAAVLSSDPQVKRAVEFFDAAASLAYLPEEGRSRVSGLVDRASDTRPRVPPSEAIIGEIKAEVFDGPDGQPAFTRKQTEKGGTE